MGYVIFPRSLFLRLVWVLQIQMDLLAKSLQMVHLGREGLWRHAMIFGPDIFFWFSSWLFFLTFQTLLCILGIQAVPHSSTLSTPSLSYTSISNHDTVTFITQDDLWHFLYFLSSQLHTNQLPNLTNFPFIFSVSSAITHLDAGPPPLMLGSL